MILIPLIFSTLERIDSISNAMDLRGFSKNKTRTWYSSKKLNKNDYLSILITFSIFIGTILVSLFVNGSRYYNPFIK